jgi:hypothetical protein
MDSPAAFGSDRDGAFGEKFCETSKSIKPLPVDAAPKPSRRLLRRLERIERLPRRKQEALLTTIDAFLGNATGKAAS